MYNMFQPRLIHNCHFSISVFSASARYIGKISKTAPISHLKHTGHFGNTQAIMVKAHFWPVII